MKARKRPPFKPVATAPAPLSGAGFQLPSKVWLDATLLDGGTRVKFEYAEGFDDPAVVKKSVALFRKLAHALPGIKARTTDRGRTVVITGNISRGRFGDMMIGEFFSWGTMGNMTLSDLLLQPLALLASKP